MRQAPSNFTEAWRLPYGFLFTRTAVLPVHKSKLTKNKLSKTNQSTFTNIGWWAKMRAEKKPATWPALLLAGIKCRHWKINAKYIQIVRLQHLWPKTNDKPHGRAEVLSPRVTHPIWMQPHRFTHRHCKEFVQNKYPPRAPRAPGSTERDASP